MAGSHVADECSPGSHRRWGRRNSPWRHSWRGERDGQEKKIGSSAKKKNIAGLETRRERREAIIGLRALPLKSTYRSKCFRQGNGALGAPTSLSLQTCRSCDAYLLLGE